MNAAKGCEAGKGMGRVTHVAWSPNILVDPPTDRRRFGPWQNQSPMVIDVKAWNVMTSGDIPY
jgi:hypothetical protein